MSTMRNYRDDFNYAVMKGNALVTAIKSVANNNAAGQFNNVMSNPTSVRVSING